MPDMEKVIEGLEKALAISKEVDSGYIWITVGEGKKALELLKEQEPVKPMAGGLCGVGGWISVKDDLPKEFGEHCIVYNGSSVQYGDYYSNGEWYTPDCYESEEIIGVTHWMPLPEQPKEENSGNEQHMS